MSFSSQSPLFTSYKSPYGPKYYYQRNFAGITSQFLVKTGVKASLFAGVGVFALLFYASGIPRIQKDILQKVPFIGHKFKKEIPASDNPF